MQRGLWLGLIVGAVLIASASAAWAQAASPVFDAHPKVKYEREPFEGAVRAGAAFVRCDCNQIEPGPALGLTGLFRFSSGAALGPFLDLARFSGRSTPLDAEPPRDITIRYSYFGFVLRMYLLQEGRLDPYVEFLPVGLSLTKSQVPEEPCGNDGLTFGAGIGLGFFASNWLRLGLGARVAFRPGHSSCDVAGGFDRDAERPGISAVSTLALEATLAAFKGGEAE